MYIISYKKMKLDKKSQRMVKEFAKNLVPIYKLYNWTWFGGEEEGSFPSAKQIENTIYYLLENIEDGEYNNISTGGLTVEKYPDAPVDIYWSLEKHLYGCEEK